MNEKDKEFLNQCCYFWKYKGDLNSFIDFDLERLRKLHPIFYTAWNQYTFAEKMLDSTVNNLYNEL